MTGAAEATGSFVCFYGAVKALPARIQERCSKAVTPRMEYAALAKLPAQ